MKKGGSLSFLVGTISNVLVMEIGWTDVGSGEYILVSCAHSNTSLFICFFEYDRKNNCCRAMVWFYCRHLSVDTVGFHAITLILVDRTFRIFNTRSLGLISTE